MSYTEYMRRKAASAPTVINNQKLRTASELTQERRLMASSDFSVDGRQYGTTRGDLLITETSVNQQNTTSFQKQTGRPKNASEFTAYVGANPIRQGNTFANGNTQNAGKVTVAGSCYNTTSTGGKLIAEPSTYVTGTTGQVSANTVARSGSDYIRERLACQKAKGEQHIQSELGPTVFKDDTISRPHFNKQYLSGAKTCAPNDMFPIVEHTHSVTVNRQAWSARPTKSGIPVFNTPSKDYAVSTGLSGTKFGDVLPSPFSISNAVGTVTASATAVLGNVTIDSPSTGYTAYTSSDLTASYVAGQYITISGYTNANAVNNISTPVQIYSIDSSKIVVVKNANQITITSSAIGVVTAAASPISLSGSILRIPTGNIPGGTGTGKIDFSPLFSNGSILIFSTTLASVPASTDANTVDFGYSIDGAARTNYISLVRGASKATVTLSGSTAATGFPTSFNIGDTFGYIATPSTLTLTYNGIQYPVTAGFTPSNTYSFFFDTTGSAITPSNGFTFINFSLTVQSYINYPNALPNCFTGKNTTGVFSRGGVIPSKHLKYVEKHHGNDLLSVNPRKPIAKKYQIPAGTPSHVKINDPNLIKTPNM